MTIRYDEKGKHYTEVESKIPKPAIIQTNKQRIHGTLHVSPGQRILDELNQPPIFLAVTDARVVDSNSEQQASFIILHKDQIIWLIPEEETGGDTHDTTR